MTLQQIANRLSEWFASPNEIDEDGYRSPSGKAIAAAYNLTPTLGADLPDMLVPDADGGISFEWHRAPELRLIRIDDEGVEKRLIYMNHVLQACTDA